MKRGVTAQARKHANCLGEEGLTKYYGRLPARSIGGIATQQKFPSSTKMRMADGGESTQANAHIENGRAATDDEHILAPPELNKEERKAKLG